MLPSLDNSKRIRMKYSEHLKFLDNELSHFYANSTCPTPPHIVVVFFKTYTTIKLIQTCFFWSWKFVFVGVGRFVTSYLRGLSLCDAVWRGGGRYKIDQKCVTPFMDGLCKWLKVKFQGLLSPLFLISAFKLMTNEHLYQVGGNGGKTTRGLDAIING